VRVVGGADHRDRARGESGLQHWGDA
jgi:hypothetical protein